MSYWAQSLDECRDASDYAYVTCAVYSCGYSQPNREHISEELLIAGQAETDCSYGDNWWLYKGGLLPDCIGMNTRMEIEYLTSMGFEQLDPDTTEPKRNDVLWRQGHTALYIGNGMQAEALRTERYDAGYNGSITGDQDGGETVVREYPAGGWTWILRPPAQEVEEVPEQEEQPTVEMGDMEPMYIINVKDDHRINPADERTAMLREGWQVLWTQGGGFKYLEHPESVRLLVDNVKHFTGKDIPQVDSSSKAPYALRLYQLTALNAQNTVLKERWIHQ